MKYVVNIGWERFEFVDGDVAMEFAKTAKMFMVPDSDNGYSRSTVRITIEDDVANEEKEED